LAKGRNKPNNRRPARPQDTNPRNPWPVVDEFVDATRTTNLTENQDFRTNDPVEFRKQDLQDTTRQIERRLEREKAGEVDRIYSGALLPDGPIRDAVKNTPLQFLRTKVEFRVPTTSESSVLRAKLELLQKERAGLGNPVDLGAAETAALAKAMSEKSGVSIATTDVENLIDWEKANVAADRFVKLNLAGKPIAADNVLRTYMSGNPELAGVLSAAIDVKREDEGLQQSIMAAAENPNAVQDFFETLGEKATAIINTYVEKVTDPIQQTVRAMGAVNAYNNKQEALGLPGGTNVEQQYAGVGKDRYNEKYLNSLADNTDYTWLEIDVAKTLHQSRVNGEKGDELIRTLYEKYQDNPESRVILSNIVEGASGDERYSKLMLQVDAAWMGNTGRYWLPGFSPSLVDEYREINDSQALQDISQWLTFGSEVLIDPFIMGTGPLRGITAMRYSLAKLGPGAKGGVGGLVSKSKWRPKNKTYRAFERFVDDLNNIEDLKAAGRVDQAAEAQRRFARHHGMYWNDELVNDVLANAPRGDSGKLTVDSVVKFADNMNDEYMDAIEHYFGEAAEMGYLVSDMPGIVTDILDDLGVQSFDQAIAAVNNGFRASRVPQAPKMSAFQSARSTMANWVGARMLPIRKQYEILAKYADSDDAVKFSEQLAENGGALGDEVRGYKMPTAPKDGDILPVAPTAFLDNVGRALTRISTETLIHFDDAASAGNIYNWTRQFLPRHMAAQIRKAWQEGTPGSRRTLMIGAIQAAGASRGIAVTRLEAENVVKLWDARSTKLRNNTTGLGNDAYGIAISDGLDTPSARLYQSEIARQEQRTRDAQAAALVNEGGFPEGDPSQGGLPMGGMAQDPNFDMVPVEVKPKGKNDIYDELEVEVGGREALMAGDDNAWALMTELEVPRINAWREEALNDPQAVESILDSIMGPNTVEDSWSSWWDNPIPGQPYSVAPSMPDSLGAKPSNTRSLRADGTISRQALADIADAYGDEKALAWLYTGYMDNYLDDSLNLPTTPRKKDMFGNDIPGWRGIPEDWYSDLEVYVPRRGRKRGKDAEISQDDLEGLTPEEQSALYAERERKAKNRRKDRGETRIAVPWARGGTRGRREAAVSELDDQYQYYREQVEAELRAGSYDDAIDNYLAGVPGDTIWVARPKVEPLKLGDAPDRADVPEPRNLGDRGGVASALHMDQTADFMRLPSIRDFEEYRQMGTTGEQVMFRGSSAAQAYTDAWSWATLAGWRFGIRNAIEENIFYFLSGGRIDDWMRGRRITTTRGRLNPQIFEYESKLFNERKFVYRQNVGVINRWLESSRTFLWRDVKGDTRVLSDVVDDWADTNGLAGMIQRYIIAPAMVPRLGVKGSGAFKGGVRGRVRQLGNEGEWLGEDFISNPEWAEAVRLLNAGDGSKFEELFLRSLVGTKIGVDNLSPAEKKLIAHVGGGSAKRGLLEEVSGSGRFISSADLPTYIDEVTGATESLPPGVGVGSVKAPPVRGSRIGVPNGFTTSGTINATFLQMWHHQLRWVMDGDGPVGQAAVEAIYKISKGQIDTTEAKSFIRDVLGSLKENDAWRQRFSNLQTIDDLDRFASDYFESVLNLFQRRDGSLNTQLLGRFFQDDTYMGWYRPAQREAVESGDGGVLLKDRISVADLRRLPDEEMPPSMMVPEIEQQIPVAENIAGIIDSSWRWSQRQNARLSKENIFWANLLRIHRNSATGRRQLGDRMQEVLPDLDREVIDETVEALSRNTYADQAYEASLAYMDNPSVRTNLAWKARNFSRYYRATEDFWRRSRRLAAQNPEAFVKAALIYGFADDSGFVYTDQFDTKFFVYPGNQFLLGTAGLLTGQGFIPKEDMPWSITGKVLGASPSLDPMNAVAGVSGVGNPIGALIFSMTPAKELPGLQALVMGPYYQPSGNAAVDIIDSALPAHLRNVVTILTKEEREASWIDSYMKAAQWMGARGDLDTLRRKNPDGTVTEIEFTGYDSLLGTMEQERLQALQWAHYLGKNALRLFAFAAPSTQMSDTSDFAKSAGIPNLDAFESQHREAVRSLRPEFWEAIANARNAEYVDPRDYALEQWLEMTNDDLDGSEYVTGSYDLSPFIPSTFESAGGTTARIANPAPYVEVREWMSDPENEYWLNNEGLSPAYLFFSPRPKDGEFDSAFWRTMRYVDRTKLKKDQVVFVDQLAAAEYNAKRGLLMRQRTNEVLDLAYDDPEYYTKKKQIEDLYGTLLNDLEDEFSVAEYQDSTQSAGSAQVAYEKMNDLLAEMRRIDGDDYGGRDLAMRFARINNLWVEFDQTRLAFPTSSERDTQKRKDAERDMWAALKKYMGPENPETEHYIYSVIARLDPTELRKGME
jgi:hypothetical protein